MLRSLYSSSKRSVEAVEPEASFFFAFRRESALTDTGSSLRDADCLRASCE